MFPRITHIALHVSDIDACVGFYQEFCAMVITHERGADKCAGAGAIQRVGEGQRIVWMAEPGRERDFIFVLMNRGQDLDLPSNDYRHLGFAVESKAAVDQIADRARRRGYLVWAPRQEPYPVGYYCGLRDPNGNYVEFSYGQPLGPGADDLEYPTQAEYPSDNGLKRD